MFKKYIDYIKNTGGNPLISEFDEDWEPIGEIVRRDMKKANLIQEIDGRIHLINP